MASVHHSRWYGFGKMGVPDSLITIREVCSIALRCESGTNCA